MKVKREDLIWLRNLLIIPLIIALIVAIVQFLLPKLFEKSLVVSHTIEGPTAYLRPETIGGLHVVINGIPTSYLFAYKVRLWNSGGLSIRNLPVRFQFEATERDFKSPP